MNGPTRLILTLALLPCTWACVLGGQMVISPSDYPLERDKMLSLQIQKVAVLPTTEDRVADELNRQIGKWAGFDLVDRPQIREVMEDLGLSPSDPFDEAKARRIGDLLGSDAVVLTAYAPGSYLRARMVEVETGLQVWQASANFRKRSIVFSEDREIKALCRIVARTLAHDTGKTQDPKADDRIGRVSWEPIVIYVVLGFAGIFLIPPI